MKRIKKDYTLKEFIDNGTQYFLRQVSVDCVIFGFHENQLKVLLLKWKDIQQRVVPPICQM